MSEVKEKFRDLIEEQNLNIFDGPFVVKNFLKNVEDYLNWNTLNDAINSVGIEWQLLGENQKSLDIPCNWPYWAELRKQNKQFIIEHVNKGSPFVVDRCCILNDNLKSLVSDIQEAFPVACDIHIYGSKGTNSKSFTPHADRYNIFIIQAIGDTDWIVYKNRISEILPFPAYRKDNDKPSEVLTPTLEVTLSPGDLLYIPPRAYHVALPSMPRLSMSIPCISLDYFDLIQHLPNFDQVVNRLPPDVNKYEF